MTSSSPSRVNQPPLRTLSCPLLVVCVCVAGVLFASLLCHSCCRGDVVVVSRDCVPSVVVCLRVLLRVTAVAHPPFPCFDVLRITVPETATEPTARPVEPRVLTASGRPGERVRCYCRGSNPTTLPLRSVLVYRGRALVSLSDQWSVVLVCGVREWALITRLELCVAAVTLITVVRQVHEHELRRLRVLHRVLQGQHLRRGWAVLLQGPGPLRAPAGHHQRRAVPRHTVRLLDHHW